MTIQRFKVSLNAARFPLVSTKGSRSVFIPGLDSAPRTPRQFIGAEQSTDYNTAQVLYMENVMPISEGLRSVGYVQNIVPTVNTDFDAIFPLRDEDENIVLYSPAHGKNYVFDAVLTAWKSSTYFSIWGIPVSGASEHTPETARITYAYVDGRTFVCYSRLISAVGDVDMSIMLWNPDSLTLTPATSLLANVPFAAGTIDGISSSNGFLLIWSGLAVAWAGFNGTAFDFSPYANGAYTGAGSQIPEDVQGPITALAPVAGGFLIFTTRNCIGASYIAQNVVAPWLFREVAGAGGVGTYEVLSVEGSLPALYAYTTSGLQRITLNSAESVHPQIADFLTGRVIERYDAITQALTQAVMGQDLSCKITNVGNRYIVISYGVSAEVYEYALVWDLALDRIGKLKFDHVDCFYFNYAPAVSGLTYDAAHSITYDDMAAVSYDASYQPPSTVVTPAQHALGFLTAAGAVYEAQWTDRNRAGDDAAVVIIGRIQLARARHTQINRIEVDGMEAGTVGVYPSYDGRTVSPLVPFIPISSSPGYLCAGHMVDAKNFDLWVAGSFDLSAIVIEAIATGQV